MSTPGTSVGGASAKAATGKSGGKQRSRPMPSQRQPGKASWSAGVEHEGGANNERNRMNKAKRKQKRATGHLHDAPGAEELFSPNAFPVIVGKESTGGRLEVPLFPSWPDVYDQMSEITLDLRSQLTTAAASAGMPLNMVMDHVDTAGLFCAAQSVGRIARTQSRSVAMWSGLLNNPLPMIRTHRTVASQYGDVNLRDSGVTLRILDPLSEIMRVARMYGLGRGQPAAQREEFRLLYWLPLRAEDDHFFDHLRLLVFEFMHSVGNEWYNYEPDLDVLTNVQPPWFGALAAADQGNVAWIFGARPAANAWPAVINAIPGGFFNEVSLEMPRPVVNADFGWGIRHAAVVNDFLDTWVSLARILEEFFTMSGSDSVPDEGSQGQVSLHTVEERTRSTTLRLRERDSEVKESLAVLYPPVVNYALSSLVNKGKLRIAMGNARTERSEWAFRSVKKPT